MTAQRWTRSSVAFEASFRGEMGVEFIKQMEHGDYARWTVRPRKDASTRLLLRAFKKVTGPKMQPALTLVRLIQTHFVDNKKQKCVANPE